MSKENTILSILAVILVITLSIFSLYMMDKCERLEKTLASITPQPPETISEDNIRLYYMLGEKGCLETVGNKYFGRIWVCPVDNDIKTYDEVQNELRAKYGTKHHLHGK